jgi:phosphoribosylanthranilate isomerase
MRTRVKICGITNIDDALAAVAAGVDALGMVFYAGSPRFVSRETAAEIIRHLPPFVAKVGLFVDATPDEVRQIVAACGLDTLQFHGAETPDYCRSFHLNAYKAFRIRSSASLAALISYDTAAWLLDSGVSGQYGGTGTSFDWSLAVEASRYGKPIILAGGLNPDNVQEAIRQTHPYAVDVSSGVESAPGRKDPSKVRDFMAAVRSF